MVRVVLAAPDKFRGTASAAEVAGAIAAGAERAGWGCVLLPLADGGEGLLAALGGANRYAQVTGPLGEPVEAGWRLEGTTAVVEMALASGLVLAGGRHHNDPEAATTAGTGELVAAAAAAGARTIVVGLGGSATTDGGDGALAALDGLVPFPEHGLEVRVACDVQTTFVDAARVFGPQKGAGPAQVKRLTARLERLADEYERRFGADVRGLPGAGAAGGLAGGLAAAGATLEPGFGLVAGLVGLDDALARAGLVVTGEGRLDETSFAGKVVGSLLERCRGTIPVFAVVGAAAGDFHDRLDYVSLVERFGESAARADTLTCIERVVEAELERRVENCSSTGWA
ncbi:MAG: glycerate kinase [Gaiellales bacterium]